MTLLSDIGHLLLCVSLFCLMELFFCFLTFLVSSHLSVILLVLRLFFKVMCLLVILGWTINLAILLLRYLRYRYRRFWQTWTLPSRRIGWRSCRGFPDSRTPLLSARCSYDCQTTSSFCQECFGILEQSRLLSGSLSIFTRRTEWYKWDIPFRGSEFKASRRSCQLCNILWFSLDEQTRLRLASPSTDPWLWLSIWDGESSRLSKSGLYYLSLFDDASWGDRPEDRRKICRVMKIREGSAPPSARCSRNADFFRKTERSISFCTYPYVDW